VKFFLEFVQKVFLIVFGIFFGDFSLPKNLQKYSEISKVYPKTLGFSLMQNIHSFLPSVTKAKFTHGAATKKVNWA